MLLAVALILAPSVLFVLLYRGLLRVQDQELIARLAEAGHLDPDSLERAGPGSQNDRRTENERAGRRAGKAGRNAGVAERRAAFLRERDDTGSRSVTRRATGEKRVSGDARELARCGNCGSENAVEFGLCRNCLEWLD